MIEQILRKIALGKFEFSQHAVDQSIIRHISAQEVREAIAEAEIIEDYPTTNTARVAYCWDSLRQVVPYISSAVILLDLG